MTPQGPHRDVAGSLPQVDTGDLPPWREAPGPWGLTEDVEGGGGRAAGPCWGLHRAVVGGGVGGSDAGEGEDRG